MTINIIDLHKNDIKLKIYDILENLNQTVGPIDVNTIGIGSRGNYSFREEPVTPSVITNPWLSNYRVPGINTIDDRLIHPSINLREEPVTPIVITSPWLNSNYRVPGIETINDRIIHPSINLRDISVSQ